MTTMSDTAPQQHIAAAEAETSKRVRQAEEAAEEELEAFRTKMEQEVESLRGELQKEGVAAQGKEKEELTKLIKEGQKETEKMCVSLREQYTRHEKTLMKALIERFLSLTFKE